MTPRETLKPSYFDDVYAADADPWQFTSSVYEQAKYDATLAALPKPRFESAFEIGCSIGVLTALLAPRCGSLLAVDVSDAALQSARQRVAGMPQVRLQKMVVPQEFPATPFDLVVLSEVGYYWAMPDLAVASQRILAALKPGAALVLVHWTPIVADYPLTGDAVHDHFLHAAQSDGSLRHLTSRREDTYRLDVLERRAAAPA